MSNKQHLRIEGLARDFIWKGKHSKTALKILQNPKKAGGLKLCNFREKEKALKISWVARLENRDDMQYVYQWLLPMIGKEIWLLNLSSERAKQLIQIDSHWRRVLIEWCSTNHQSMFSGKEVLNEIIWYNSNVCVNKCTLINSDCWKANLKKFGDLVDADGNRIPLNLLNDKYGTKLNWLTYETICKAIPKTWWYLAKGNEMDEVSTMYESVITRKKCVAFVYDMLINKDALDNILTKYNKFFREHDIEIDVQQYCTFFTAINKKTNCTKLRDFQYRHFILSIYGNVISNQWKVVQTEQCEFCEERQTLKHLFWECEKVQELCV